MFLHYFSFPPNCHVGVGKTMNISLENLHDTKRPKWAHFGPRKTPETAAKVRDLLENEQYKPSGSEATGPSPDHEEPDTAVPQIPSLPATLKGVKNIEPGMTKEELRLRELEVEVAEAHAKDYLAQAVDEQRKAEDRLVETQEALKDGLQESEIQTVEVLKEETATLPSKVEIQHTEADPTAHPSNVEQQRSEADILRNLELQRALEAKAAAEARAAEESRRTAEFQTSLLAQFAAMQAELAALKAERAAEKMQKYIRPMPAPAPSQDIKHVESEVLVEGPKADPPPILVGELLPKPGSDSVHISEKRVEEVLTPPEAPAVNRAALLSQESMQSTKAKQMASLEPTEDSLIVETQKKKVSKGVTPALSPPRPGVTTRSPESAVSPSSPLTPVVNEIRAENEKEGAKPKPGSIEISLSSLPKLPNKSFIAETQTLDMPEKPDLGRIPESTIEESVVKPIYDVSPIEAPAEKALTKESSSVEAQTTELPTGAALSEESMVITTEKAFQAEAQQEEIYRREVSTEEASPVEPHEAKEASMGTALVEEEGCTNAEVQELAPESQSSSSPEYPPSSSNSFNTTGATVEREGELHPGAKIAFGDSEISDLPLPSRTQGTQGTVKGQPEVKRDEEPAPEKQEKPAVTKDDKPSRS